MSTKVLLIEDADDIVRLIRHILEDEGYDLRVATDGEAGWAAVRQERPDIILLDMALPKLSGWDLAPRFREAYPDLPVIALTAHTMRGDRERALSLGCTDYMSKPFEIDALLDMIEHYSG